jgi:hypothetical protein
VSDATGHMDRPGAGPTSVNLVNPYTGMLANLYYHPNPISNKHEIVKPNPPGVSDEVLAEFETVAEAESGFAITANEILEIRGRDLTWDLRTTRDGR